MPNGVELATGYVSLSLSGKNVAGDLNKIFGEVDKTSDKKGRSAAGSFMDGIRDGIRQGRGRTDRAVGGTLDKADDKAGSQGRSAGGKFMDGLRSTVKRDGGKVSREVERVGDDSGKRFTSGMKGAVAKAGGLLAIVGGVGAGVDFFKDAITDASNLEQSVGGVEAVFGKYAATVKKDSKGAAQSLGLTENAYNELITVSGAMLKNKGLKDFADQSKNLITTGADLAAQYGGSTKDAVDALNAAMRGESDPIERYGISLNAAAIQAEALATGIAKPAKNLADIRAKQNLATVAQRNYTEAVKKHGKGSSEALKAEAALTRANAGLSKAMAGSKVELTDQQKAQAALSLVSRQSADAQGAFGREADTAAGKQQRLTARLENSRTEIGQKLLPVYSGFLSFIADKLLPGLGKAGDFLGGMWNKGKDAFQALTDLLFKGDFTAKFRKVFGVEEDAPVVDFLFTLRDFFVQNLPPAIETGRKAFASIVAFIRDEVVPRFRGIYDAIFKLYATAIPIVQQFVTGMIKRIQPMIPTIRDIFKTIGSIITGALDLVKAVIERVTAVIAYIWKRWGNDIMNFIATIWQAILNVIRPALATIQSIIQVFIRVFKGDWSGAWSAVKDVVKNAWATIRALVDGGLKIVKGLLSGAWAVIKAGASAAWGGITSAIGSAWDGLTGIIAGPIDRAMQFVQENLIDKINGLFEFLNVSFRIKPIWEATNTGFRNAGRLGTSRKLGDRGYADGGMIAGPYVGPKADNVLIRANPREFMQPVAAVNHYGTAFMEAVRTRQFPLQALANGGMVKPVNANPSFPWGRYPSGGVHRALDLAVPTGTLVRAPFAGRVLYAGWDTTGYGNVVRTADADGAYSILGHNSRLLVKTGQALAAGQGVALSGSTGRSSGPHVHFARRTSPYNDASAFNFSSAFFGGTGGGPPAGGGNGVLASLITDGIGKIANGLGGTLDSYGPFGKLLGGIASKLVTAIGNKGVSLLGLDAGGGFGREIVPTQFDSGRGVLMPGKPVIALNKTRQPEYYLNDDRIREIAGMGNGGGRQIVINGNVGMQPQDVASAIAREERKALALSRNYGD